MTTIDLSLSNTQLYAGCVVETVAGRLNLLTPTAEAVEIVGRNIAAMPVDADSVLLTGPMAVWSYLCVFHSVVHKTNRVLYCDGRNPAVTIAAHGA